MAGNPREQYSRVVNVIPAKASLQRAKEIFLESWRRGRETVSGSYDDGGIGNLDSRTVRLYDLAQDDKVALINWYFTHYAGVRVGFNDIPGSHFAPYSGPPGLRGNPREQYGRVVNVIPHDTNEELALAIFEEAWLRGRETVTGSYDDAGIGNLTNRAARLYNIPARERQSYIDWYALHYPGANVIFADKHLLQLNIVDITGRLPKHPEKRYETRPLPGIAYMVIHHSAGSGQTESAIEAIARQHIASNNWPGIGYTFVINNAGQVWQVNNLNTWSFHSGSEIGNRTGIGVCLLGNFTTVIPPNAQIDAARLLFSHLKATLGKALRLARHQDFINTDCPGETWPQWLHRIHDTVPPPEPRAVVAVDVLNVRNGPGTNHAIVTQVTNGTSLILLGRNSANTWLYVKIPSVANGWVSSTYVSANAPITSLPV